MADAASIGAGASRYTGDANLGGGTFGFVKLDVSPIVDLGRYVMLYNKAEYDQRQKDAESASGEIAEMTKYDISTGIPKDAKLLQKKYDDLLNFVRENPDAINYRNKELYMKFNAMKNDLTTDITGAKQRYAMYSLRQNEISKAPTQKEKDNLTSELEDEINKKGIREPLFHTQEYAVQDIKMPAPATLNFDISKKGPDGVWNRNTKILNMSKLWANSGAFSIGFNQFIDDSTPQGKREKLSRENNFWVKGAEFFNSAINAVDDAGKPLYKKTISDTSTGETKFMLDEEKLSKMPRSILNLVKEFNKYVTEMKTDIKRGDYRDAMGNGISFGDGALDESDYRTIDYTDGISPEELAAVAQYAEWQGISYTTKYEQNDDAIQRRGQSLDYSIAKARLDFEKERSNGVDPSVSVKQGSIKAASDIYKRIVANNGLQGISQDDAAVIPGLGIWDKDQNRFVPNSGWENSKVELKDVKLQDGQTVKGLYINGKLVYENNIADNIGEMIIKQTAGTESKAYGRTAVNESNAGKEDNTISIYDLPEDAVFFNSSGVITKVPPYYAKDPKTGVLKKVKEN